MKKVNKLEVLAVIPARGGSKGIPNKNMINFGGKPLVAWNIEAALDSKSVSRVVVSTDSAEIAEISRRYGAEIVDRPECLSGDGATSESALIHALQVLENEDNYCPDLLCFMQCTSPLTVAADIDNAVQKLIKDGADSCFTAKEFHYFVWEEDADGALSGINHDKSCRQRRQDIHPQYEENGAVYVMKTNGFLASKHRFFGKTIVSLMTPENSVEIDDRIDLVVADAMLKFREGNVVGNKNKLLNFMPEAVLFDFDGVFTNNKVYLDESGVESVCCDRSDGWGLRKLRESGVKIAVLSTEVNLVVSARCAKLEIECCQGLGDRKFEAFKKWCDDNDVASEKVIFVGNDVNDIECLVASGFGVVPADAHQDARGVADKVLAKSGGNGAVRELCDFLQAHRIV